MLNFIPSGGAVLALQKLRRCKIAASWIGDRVEFRSAVKPPDDVISLIDAHEPDIVRALRPNGDGKSPFELAQERHRPLMESTEAQRPTDVDDARWQAAMDGLEVFLLSGCADEALRLGWPKDELFRAPQLWSQIHLCGAGLLIGDKTVVEVAADAIQMRTPSGATQTFYRRPAVDYRVAYRAHLAPGECDGPKAEAELRAFEATMRLYCANTGCDLETAKAAVRDVIKRIPTKETTTP